MKFFLNINNIIFFNNLQNYYIMYKNNNNILYIKIYINNIIFLKDFKYLIFFIKQKLNILFNKNLFFFYKIFNIGLGYKNFIYNNFLYLYLGDANYYKIKYANIINIICKKNQLIFLSNNNNILYNFISKIFRIKNINNYKGKGLIPFINFKFMKLKKGKKKT